MRKVGKDPFPGPDAASAGVKAVFVRHQSCVCIPRIMVTFIKMEPGNTRPHHGKGQHSVFLRQYLRMPLMFASLQTFMATGHHIDIVAERGNDSYSQN